MRPAVTALVALLLLGGCWGNEESAFPEGLEPLEENGLLPPEGTEADPYPDEILVEGMDGGRYGTVFARGYFHAPLADVWAAFRDPEVGTDRRSASEWSVELLADEAYDESYVVYAVAYEIVTVEWWTTWRHGLIEGTPEAPELVAIRWQKTDGSTILRVIEGSIVLRAVGDGSVTEIDFVYHASALGAGLGEFVQYVNDVLADARALLAGEALPTY